MNADGKKRERRGIAIRGKLYSTGLSLPSRSEAGSKCAVVYNAQRRGNQSLHDGSSSSVTAAVYTRSNGGSPCAQAQSWLWFC